MKFLYIAAAILLIAVSARADVNVVSIDINVPIVYASSNVKIDVNFSYDSDINASIRLYDNNELIGETAKNLLSDGNTFFEKTSFETAFDEGSHIIIAKIFDVDINEQAAEFSKELTVFPGENEDTIISQKVLDLYILPLAQSYSMCVSEKADLNLMYIQNQAALKQALNDAIIANEKKQAAEDSLEQKKKEHEACLSAKSVCEADKTTLNSKYLNAESKCSTEKNTLKEEKEKECNSLLFAKDEILAARDKLILETNLSKHYMELVAFTFGALFFLVCGIIAFLYYKERIK